MSASLAHPLDASLARLGTHDDDGNACRLGARPQLVQHLLPGDVGQVEVEQHEVGPTVASQLESDAAVGRLEHRQPRLTRERAPDELQICEVVLDVEDRCGVPGLCRGIGRTRIERGEGVVGSQAARP